MICIAALSSAPSLAQTVTFNFDTAPGGAPIASGTIVNNIYACQGLTLSRTATGALSNSAGNIFANNNRPADFTISSAPNVVSQCTPPIAADVSENNFGAIRADLASPASQACINVRPDGATDRAVLRAYDASAVLLISTTSAPGMIQTLCVSAANIRRVEFSGAGDTFAIFDDLAITFAGAPPPAVVSTPVPALSPWFVLILAGALATAAAQMLRRR